MLSQTQRLSSHHSTQDKDMRNTMTYLTKRKADAQYKLDYLTNEIVKGMRVGELMDVMGEIERLTLQVATLDNQIAMERECEDKA